jgi:hypothetical protein
MMSRPPSLLDDKKLLREAMESMGNNLSFEEWERILNDNSVYNKKPPIDLPDAYHLVKNQIWDIYFSLFSKTNIPSAVNTFNKIEEADKLIKALKEMKIFNEPDTMELIELLESKQRWWRGELIFRYKEQVASSELNCITCGKVDEYGEWVIDQEAWNKMIDKGE